MAQTGWACFYADSNMHEQEQHALLVIGNSDVRSGSEPRGLS